MVLTYQPRGLAKLHQTPKGFTTNYYHQKIGSTHAEFLEAKRIIANLDHLNWEWVECMTEPNQLQLDSIIATQVRYLGVWALDISKVIEIIDEKTDDLIRFGYVMGSTKYHVLHGEEAFILEYNRQNEETHYHIYSYSKPRGSLMRLGGPLIRRAQRKFVRAAAQYLIDKLP